MKDSFPTKRDYWYLLIIMSITILFILSHSLSNDEHLSELLGFSGTIVSIILAVIAIILTLTESSKIAKANEQILDSSNIITTSANDIDNIVTNLKNLNINEEINNLKFYISSLLSSMEENVITRVGSVLDNSFALGPDVHNVENEARGISNNKDFIKYFINSFSGHYSMNIKYISYFILKLCKESKSLNNIFEFTNILYPKDSENGNTYRNVFTGFVIVFVALNFFHLSFQENSNILITDFDSSFEDIINEFIIMDDNIKSYVDINYNNIFHIVT